MTALPHYRHLAAGDRTAAVIEAAVCLLGLLVRLWRWMFPAFDRGLIGRHDLDAVHPGATIEYAEVLHQLDVTCDLDPVGIAMWTWHDRLMGYGRELTEWRGGELVSSDA